MSGDEGVSRQHRHTVGMLAFGLLVVFVLCCLLLTPRLPRSSQGKGAEESGVSVFDGKLADDILSAGEGLLTVEHALVRDNGEGQLPPHGPYGSIHVKVYRPEQSPEAPWRPDLELRETMLYGPHQTVGDLFEWLDDEEVAYVDYALYDWNLQGLDQVLLRVYESDPGPGRQHDDLLVALVSREETQEAAVTLYSDKMEIRLRTRDLRDAP